MAGSTKRVTTRRAAATERFHREAARKKVGPVAILIGLIAAGFVMAAGFILFGGGTDPRITRDRISGLLEQARRLEQEGKPGPALALFRQALDHMSDDAAYRTDALHLKGTIRQLEQEQKDRAAADARFEAFRAKAAACADGEVSEVLKSGQELLRSYERSGLPWLGGARRLVQALEKRQAVTRIGCPANIRAEILKARKLEDRRLADFGGAIGDWRAYIARGPGADDRRRAEEEIRRLNARAYEELERLKRAAEREGKDVLRREKARFEGTDHAAALEAALR